MIATDLVFWVDVVGVSGADAGGLLCTRHADAMTVPRGWTLDDRRDPDLRLFRPPRAPAVESATRRRPARGRRSTTPPEARQLELDPLGHGDASREPNRDVVSASAATASDRDVAGDSTGDESSGARVAQVDPDLATVHELPATPEWRPTFDPDDDLDGMLTARSPLLSRAFGGVGRER